jgi:hypothetical protein
MEKPPRSRRVARLARKLALHWERQRHSLGGDRKKPLARRERKPRVKRMIAYDLETTRIAAGTPRPLYLTAFCDEWKCSLRISSISHLLEVLETRFFTDEFLGTRFVGWNANNFDVFFIGLAVLGCERYVIRPYLTRSKSLRGLKVMRRGEKKGWEFLDGLAMTGLSSTPLRKLDDFLRVFAPDYRKLEAPDFDAGENFNPLNPKHVAYAERDSEGLYRGLQAFERITLEHFAMPLQPTIGNMGIKIFQSHMPASAVVWEPNLAALRAIRDYVMRGGFCFCVERFEGPVWKYDINQAYAAAMRDCLLPSGGCVHSRSVHPYAATGIYRVRATNPRNKIPFYYRSLDRLPVFGTSEVGETWITSLEVAQLKAEGWAVDVLEGYFWDEAFRMREYVDKLEGLRVNAPGGPGGAQGLIMKCIGNNSYGKTVEQLDGIDLLMANECPEGFSEYQSEDECANGRLWFKFGKPVLREYHQPQLGAFITAHVRMEVRRAALLAPDAWLYADTDCVMFDQAVALPVDPSRYGAWKLEAAGVPYLVIAKKVYTDLNYAAPIETRSRHAKGMNVRRLSDADFAGWHKGSWTDSDTGEVLISPRQKQVQRQNFVKAMTGEPMFIERTKVGQRV